MDCPAEGRRTGDRSEAERKRLPVWLDVVAQLLPGAVLSWTWGLVMWRTALAPPVGVHGIVVNVKGRPLLVALVFAVSQPRNLVRTSAEGRFKRPSLPVGRETFIVVNSEMGQEFTVCIAPGDTFDAVTSQYVAPPDR